ncbi:MAG: sulfatase [Actinomycetota bacterium]|nr:sulfatase [Actinomycetota bacterium]
MRRFLPLLVLAAALCIPLPARAGTTKPNIVLILTDDQRWDTLSYMPNVRKLINHGTPFTNSFVPNPECCPSRASILTGRYSGSTDVWGNTYPHGGWQTFHRSGDERSTIATWLDHGGYRTGLFGKYLNDYDSLQGRTFVPPGWDVWNAYATKPDYYNYDVNRNGTIVHFANANADYAVDAFAHMTAQFIRNTGNNTPLFAYYAPLAPHTPTTPPERYKNRFAHLPPIRTPSIPETDRTDKPPWIQDRRDISPQTAAEFRARQLRVNLAIDDAVGRIVRALSRTGRLSNTLIMFASDNGYLWGEHSWRGKAVPYNESLRVPLVVRWDAVKAPSVVDNFALNVDWAPTFAQVAGVHAPGVEGRSLVPLLRNKRVRWRKSFVVEHLGSLEDGIPSYCGIRTHSFLYVQYAGGFEEVYAERRDPYELANVVRRIPDATLKLLRQQAHALCDPPPPGWGWSH